MPDPIDIHVGSHVKQRRLALGWSQSRLGAALGVTFQQVQKYEKGSNRIGASTLHRIASALGVGPAFFFEGIGPSPVAVGDPAAPTATADRRERETARLIHHYARVRDVTIRRRVLRLIRALAEEDDVPDVA